MYGAEMASFGMTELFGIPLYKSYLSLDTSTIENLVKQDFCRMEAGNGFCSKDNNVLDSQHEVKAQILKALNHLVFSILKVKDNLEFEIQNSWITKHSPGDWSHKHDHVNSILSGIVYLQVNNDSGDLVLHKDSLWQNIFPRCLNVQFDHNTSLTASEWKITPQNNEIYIFPSFLAHSVEANMGNEDRYVLAFNVFPRGQLGTSSLNSIKV
jgi:uncharacterized protein (TIGR02466 family)